MGKNKKKKSSQPSKIVRVFSNFDAARQDRRTSGWLSQDTGPNSTLRRDWRWLVKRHQDLADNDGLAKKAVGVIVQNWIGDGIISNPIGATKKYANAYTQWARMVEGDFYEMFNNYGNQALGARAATVRGAYLLRKRINPDLFEKYGVVPLQLQLMEAEWLDTTKDNGVDILFGQQFDSAGRLQGYWIRDQHPNESVLGRGISIQSSFVSKDEITLIFDCLRPGQRMGIPFGTAAILTLRDIADINEAQQLKDKIAACFFGVTTGDEPIYPNPGDSEEIVENAKIFDTIAPGAVEHIPNGRSFQAFTPPPAGDFYNTQKVYARRVAAAYEITYESLTGDTSDSNFSSYRGQWLEFHRRVAHLRWNVFIPRHCATVCRWHDDLARVAGLLRGQATWEHTPPRREMIDPTREIPALIEAVKAGFMSLSEVQKSFGYVPEEVIMALDADIKRARDKELYLSIDGRNERKVDPPVESTSSANTR
jgi:lambda family phage portal protein